MGVISARNTVVMLQYTTKLSIARSWSWLLTRWCISVRKKRNTENFYLNVRKITIGFLEWRVEPPFRKCQISPIGIVTGRAIFYQTHISNFRNANTDRFNCHSRPLNANFRTFSAVTRRTLNHLSVWWMWADFGLRSGEMRLKMRAMSYWCMVVSVLVSLIFALRVEYHRMERMQVGADSGSLWNRWPQITVLNKNNTWPIFKLWLT